MDFGRSIYPGAALGIAVGFLVGIVIHHLAHARMAIALGDRSAKLGGRTSLSIKRHADVLGSYIMTGVWAVVIFFGGPYLPMFAWGQPQAANPFALRRTKRDAVVVALAGPVATLVLGVAAGLARRSISGEAGAFVGGVAVACILLTVFEILPIPGRDGGQILAQFLSPTGRLRFQELAEYHVAFIVAIFVIPQLLQFRNPMAGFAELICGPVVGSGTSLLSCHILMS